MGVFGADDAAIQIHGDGIGPGLLLRGQRGPVFLTERREIEAHGTVDFPELVQLDAVQRLLDTGPQHLLLLTPDVVVVVADGE